MASIKIGGVKLATEVLPDEKNKMHLCLHIEGHLSLSDILLYLIIDGLIWFSLFVVVLP